MAQLQLAFTKAVEKKNRLMVLKSNYKQLLQDNHQYGKVTEELEKYSYQRKVVLQEISDANPKLVEELEALNADFRMDKELLGDLAIKEYVENGKATVKDDDGNVYYPVFSVKFKRETEVEKEK